MSDKLVPKKEKRIEDENVNLPSSTKWCDVCKIDISADYFSTHLKGMAHLMEIKSTPAPHNLYIRPDNIGYKMLVRAGWKYSKGLGAQEQGRRIPVLPKLKKDRSGIGAKPQDIKPAEENKLSKKKAVAKEDSDRAKRLKIMAYLRE